MGYVEMVMELREDDDRIVIDEWGTTEFGPGVRFRAYRNDELTCEVVIPGVESRKIAKYIREAADMSRDRLAGR